MEASWPKRPDCEGKDGAADALAGIGASVVALGMAVFITDYLTRPAKSLALAKALSPPHFLVNLQPRSSKGAASSALPILQWQDAILNNVPGCQSTKSANGSRPADG